MSAFLDPITVNQLSSKPTEAWEVLKNTPGPLQPQVMRFKVKAPTKPTTPDKIRFVCISDTHSLTSHLKRTIPEGDVLIHAGDFTRCGHLQEVKEFNTWLGTLPHKHKIVIAGNHELSFDQKFRDKMETNAQNINAPESVEAPFSPRMVYGGRGGNDAHSAFSVSRSTSTTKMPDMSKLQLDRLSLEDCNEINEEPSVEEMKAELTNCIYLQDSTTQIYGLKIYGTPWQPEFCGWAFNLPRGQECLNKWDKIPDDTDILISHTPPVGYGDLCCTGVRAGCVELLSTVRLRVRPKYHIYGHIHEGYGVRSDGKVIFINASTCDINYMPTNKPIVFDISLPKGHSKDE